MWSALDEITRRVDVNCVIVICKLRWDDRTNNLLDQIRANHCVSRLSIGVLRGDENSGKSNWFPIFVFERHLSFSVWTQVWNRTRFTNFGKFFGHAVCEPNRQWHQFGCLVTRVTKHHSLVAGALAIEFVFAALARANFFALVYALRNVRALFIDGNDDATGIAIETVQRVVVTNVFDYFASQLWNVDICRSGDLASYNTQTGSEKGFAGDSTLWVFRQNCVQDGIRNLVGHLVGVSFGNALRSEGKVSHEYSSSADTTIRH